MSPVNLDGSVPKHWSESRPHDIVKRRTAKRELAVLVLRGVCGRKEDADNLSADSTR